MTIYGLSPTTGAERTLELEKTAEGLLLHSRDEEGYGDLDRIVVEPELLLAALIDRPTERTTIKSEGALGDARKAIEFYEQYLAIAREIGDRRGEGNGLWDSALAFDKLGDRAQAIARAEAALRIFEAIEDPRTAKVRAQLAQWRGK